MSTNSVVPAEGPFVSGLFNTPRAVSEATGTWLVQLIFRWRGGLHSSRLSDQLGQERFGLPGAAAPGAGAAVQAQSVVLTISDAFFIMGVLTAALLVVLAVLPVRTYPPRIVFAKS